MYKRLKLDLFLGKSNDEFLSTARALEDDPAFSVSSGGSGNGDCHYPFLYRLVAKPPTFTSGTFYKVAFEIYRLIDLLNH